MKPYDEDIKRLNKEKEIIDRNDNYTCGNKTDNYISETFHKMDILNEKIKLYLNISIIWILSKIANYKI